MRIRTVLASLALAITAVLPAAAHHDGHIFTKGAAKVSHAWTVETGKTAHAVEIYMTIENTGDAPIRLTGASVRLADAGVFQSPVVGDDGALSVRELTAVEIAPGQSITMQPAGLHIVFNDVQRTLRAGGHFHATLTFAEIGALEIDVDVERARGETGS